MSQTRSLLVVSQHYSPELSGNAPYAARLASGLSGSFSVRVATTHAHYPQWKFLEHRPPMTRVEQVGGVGVTRLRHYVPRAPSAARRALSELSFGIRVLFMRTKRPEIVLFLSPGLISSAVASLRFRRSKRIVWVQDLYSRGLEETGTGGGWVRKLFKSVESWLLRDAHQVWSIHPRFTKYMTQRLRVPSRNVYTVRNWTHIQVPTGLDRAAARRKLNWDPTTVVALHAGNQGVKQGLENVVNAARISDSLPQDVRFVLLGNGNQHDRLIEAARGVSSIEFLDALPGGDYEAALLAADILLVNEAPGVTEMSVPSKLTSYFAVGTPVVAATSEDSATADEIRESSGGAIVPNGDPRALVDAIIAMASDPVARDRYGKPAKQYVTHNLSERSAISRATDLLSSV